MTSNIQVLYQHGMKKNSVEYILHWMLSFLHASYKMETYQPGRKIDSSVFVLSYGFDLPAVQGGPHLHIAAADFFFPEYYLNPMLHAEKPTWYENIPLAFPSRYPNPVTELTENTQRLIVPDILASAFFLLSRYEEFVYSGPLDSRGRFTSAASWMGRFSLLHRPLVDEYQLALQSWIKRLAPHLTFNQPDWQGRPFAVALTRDIDSLYKAPPPNLVGLARSIKHGEFVSGIKKLVKGAAVHYFNQYDPYNNLEQLIEWERKLGIRSSIYFMSSNVIGDSNYCLKEIFKKSQYLHKAQQEGWEFGFQPGFRTSQDGKFFTDEYVKASSSLGPMYGGRQHTLRFKVPETWRLWEKAGLQYDSTLGYADHEGFRCGTCFPYNPFDLAEDRPMELWEIPLTVMDDTFTKYRSLDAAQAGRIMEQLFETVQRQRGVFVLLWHNTYFSRGNIGDYHDLFAGFLQNALDAGAQVGTLKDILSSWTNFRGS
jgi:hypothetical protein